MQAVQLRTPSCHSHLQERQEASPVEQDEPERTTCGNHAESWKAARAWSQISSGGESTGSLPQTKPFDFEDE